MAMRKATHLALALLVAAAPGVAVRSARAQTTAKKKSPGTGAKSGGASHHSKSTNRSAKSRGRERGQKAPAPERITEIQQALAKDGSFGAAPNGKWDETTVDAMKKFQEAHGLNPSGKLDAKTLQKLGLGSQTAGLAPPMPPVSSSSLGTSPAPTVHPRQ